MQRVYATSTESAIKGMFHVLARENHSVRLRSRLGGCYASASDGFERECDDAGCRNLWVSVYGSNA